MFLRFFSTATLIAGLQFNAFASDSADLFLLRGFPEQSAELKLQLAKFAEPLWVEVNNPITLSRLLDETCGHLEPEVKEEFLTISKSLNGFDSQDAIAEPGFAIAIPFCTLVTPNKQVVVKESDTISELLRKYTGIYGPNSIRRTVAKWRDSQFEDISINEANELAKSIRPGQVITLAYNSPQRLYIGRNTSSLLPELLNKSLPPNYQVSVAENLAQTVAMTNTMTVESQATNPDTRSIVNSIDARSVELIELASASQSGNCNTSNRQRPFNSDQFDRVISLQLSVLQQNDLSPKKTRVGLIDSGLEGFEGDVFKRHYFAVNQREDSPFATNQVDDDENSFVDDILGINFEGEPNRIKPFPWTDTRKKAHGTQVASLAIGGLDHIETSEFTNLIEMVIVNFGKRGGGLQNSYNLLRAIEYLRNRNVTLVNMSLTTKLRLQAISLNSKMLFIAAAGNSKQDVFSANSYPAVFGGNNNYEAGIVTFVASSINSLTDGGMSPGQIKDRLIVSADFVQDFTDYGDALLLNPYKAVSLYHDAVERASPSGEMILDIGNLVTPDKIHQACEKVEDRVNINHVKKMIPNLMISLLWSSSQMMVKTDH